MSIEKMLMVNIVGKFKQLDDAIEAYLDSDCFQPETASQLIGNVKGFTTVGEDNPYAGYLKRLTEIIENSGLKPKIVEHAGATASIDEIDRTMQKLEERLGALQNQRSNIEASNAKIKADLLALSHFEQLDISIGEAFRSKYVKFRLGRLPEESFEKLKFYNSNPYVSFIPCSTENGSIWGMYVTPGSDAAEIDSIFNSLFFERLIIPDCDGTPKQAIEKLNAELLDNERKCSELTDIISEFNNLEMDEYFKLYTQLKRSYDAFEIRKYATKYSDSFVLIGWIPVSKQAEFEQSMNTVDAIEYSYSEPSENKSVEPPVKLKNIKLFRPFEYYVEMFGVPSYNEIDPTPLMAILYTLLFGIMFADVGQGIVLAIVGFLMYKLKDMKIGLILVPCGICGSVFGAVFGSVFGFEHMLDPMYHAMGFSEKPIEVMSSINQILICAVAIGVVLMIVAILLNIFCCFKRHQPGQALASENGIAGLLIYLSIIGIVLSMLFSLSGTISLICIITLCVALVCVMFKEAIISRIDEHKRLKPDGSMAEYIMQSFFELFEAVLSYVTNTVSFLRVGAFVLVHAGMMMVFFTLAAMMPNAVLYYTVIVFGNILVLVLEGLLVGVQSLRLMFYEMFSRFYAGEGRPYQPAKIGEESNKSA